MVIHSLDSLLPFIQSQGYTILFIILFFEGPIATYAAAFASSLGYFNWSIVLILSILGNSLPDVVYYAIGYSTKTVALHKYFHRLGLTEKRMKSIESGLKNHAGKMMIAVKVIPPLPAFGLTAAGRVLPFGKFFFYSFTISVVYSIIFFALGYYSGVAYSMILAYVKVVEIVLAAFVVAFICGWILLRYWIRKRFKSAG